MTTIYGGGRSLPGEKINGGMRLLTQDSRTLYHPPTSHLETSADFDIIGITGRFLFGHCSVRLSEFCDPNLQLGYIHSIVRLDRFDPDFRALPVPQARRRHRFLCVSNPSQTYWPLICYLDAKPIFSVWWPRWEASVKTLGVLIYCNCKDFSSAHVGRPSGQCTLGALW